MGRRSIRWVLLKNQKYFAIISSTNRDSFHHVTRKPLTSWFFAFGLFPTGICWWHTSTVGIWFGMFGFRHHFSILPPKERHPTPCLHSLGTGLSSLQHCLRYVKHKHDGPTSDNGVWWSRAWLLTPLFNDVTRASWKRIEHTVLKMVTFKRFANYWILMRSARKNYRHPPLTVDVPSLKWKAMGWKVIPLFWTRTLRKVDLTVYYTFFMFSIVIGSHPPIPWSGMRCKQFILTLLVYTSVEPQTSTIWLVEPSSVDGFLSSRICANFISEISIM